MDGHGKQEPFRHEEFPFQSRFLEIGKYKLHYIDEGRGPAILMLHSCPLWTFEFRKLILKLRETHRIVAFDQMGFGLSDKPLDYDYRLETHMYHIEKVVKELDLKKFTMLTHGRGATIGMSFAVRRPEDVTGFITLNAIAFSGFRLPFRLQMCRLKWLGAKLVMHLNVFMRDFYHLPENIRKAYFYPFPTTESKIAFLRFIEDIPCMPEDASSQTMLEIQSAMWQLRDKPSCIIWGGKDWLYKLRNRKPVIQCFPLSEVHDLPNAGRCLTEDAPEEVNRIVCEFLEKHHL